MSIRYTQIVNTLATDTGRAKVFILAVDGDVKGMIERLANDRHTEHPWKMYRGKVGKMEFIGAVYADRICESGYRAKMLTCAEIILGKKLKKDALAVDTV